MLIEDIRDNEWLAPICQSDLPWSFRPAGLAVVGSVVMPVDPKQRRAIGPEPPAGAYPLDWKSWLAQRDTVPMPQPSFAELRAAVSTWFTHIAPRIDMLADTTTLTRVLSVLAEVTLPGVHPGSMYNDYARTLLWMCVVPRGNLDTLLWLAWRLCSAFARRVDACAEALQRVNDVREIDEKIKQATAGMGICPAHDFGRTMAGEFEGGKENQVGVPLWPGTSAVRMAERAVRLMVRATRSARALNVRQSRSMAYAMRVVHDPRPSSGRPKDHSKALAHNLYVYRHACADILEAVVTALRVCGSAAARSWQFRHPEDTRLGQHPVGFSPVRSAQARAEAWKGVMACLKPLADADPNMLDHHFPVAFRESGLPFEWLEYCEADLWRRWQRMAWIGTALAWGVLPGDMDSPRFCGAYHPPDAPPFIPDAYYGQAITIEIPKDYTHPLLRALYERAVAPVRAWKP